MLEGLLELVFGGGFGFGIGIDRRIGFEPDVNRKFGFDPDTDTDPDPDFQAGSTPTPTPSRLGHSCLGRVFLSQLSAMFFSEREVQV